MFFVSKKLRPHVTFGGAVDAVAAHDLVFDVRVFGDVVYSVTDPVVFVTKFAGTSGADVASAVMDMVRSQVLAAVREERSSFMKDNEILHLGDSQDEAEVAVLAKANVTLAAIGVTLDHFGELNINANQADLAELKKLASRKAMVNIAGDYQTFALGEALLNSGADGGGSAGNTLLMAQLMAAMGAKSGPFSPMNVPANVTAAAPAAVPSFTCRKCDHAVSQDAKFCQNCGTGVLCGGCGVFLAAGSFCSGCGLAIS